MLDLDAEDMEALDRDLAVLHRAEQDAARPSRR